MVRLPPERSAGQQIANGYRGAWGVTCAEDPFEARSGMPFPDARARLIESLAILVEQE
jgi:hypothetical protein